MNQGDIESYGMKNLKCCACSLGIHQLGELNVIITTKLATWKCPVYGSIDDPDFPPRAVAIVCDDCAREHAKVIYCVEFVSSALVKYHVLDNLDEVKVAEKKMKSYFGKKKEIGDIGPEQCRLKANAAKNLSKN